MLKLDTKNTKTKDFKDINTHFVCAAIRSSQTPSSNKLTT